MCPPSTEWLGRLRNKQLAQPTSNAHFRQQAVTLDSSAGSPLGDQGSDGPIDSTTELSVARDRLKL